MKQNIKMFSFDLDGTLLNDHKKLSDATIEALLDYQKKGYRITLASGRYFQEIKRFAEQLELDKYHGYAVCGNGYEVIDIHSQTHKYFELIDENIVKECIDLANQYHLFQYIKINGTYYLSTNKTEQVAMKGITKLFQIAVKCGIQQLSYAAHLLSESIFKKDLVPYIHNGIVKICVIGTPSNQKKWVQDLEKRYPDTFAYYPVNPLALEITHHSVSKKNAVEYICQENNMTLENVMAFGDSGNDEPLLLSCGLGITMKNGTKRALQKAKNISEYTNHEDGVIKALQKYIEV